LWISYWEPFHGAQKKDFGFQITLKVVEDKGNGEEKKPEAEEKLPEPVPEPKPLPKPAGKPGPKPLF
jgi:hypothetical protein